ncbi:MAG: helix-turn-helix transcriptional regulator [Sphaerochaetaceae bacterium]|nr:helix-turn-helix transcriptional regulator [Sphaerochaetaceae bacterium]
MKITNTLSDAAVMEEFGSRLARLRIDKGYSQKDLAEQAGIGKRTLERLENGMQVQSRSIIRVLRCLELLDICDNLLPTSTLRPMELLEKREKPRMRVSSKKVESEPWEWGE